MELNPESIKTLWKNSYWACTLSTSFCVNLSFILKCVVKIAKGISENLLFKVCHSLYLHMSSESLLPPERQPLVPRNMDLAHIVLKQLPGRGMPTHRAVSTLHHAGYTHSPGFTVISPPLGTYQKGVSVTERVTELQVATVQRGAACWELSGISVFSQCGTSLQEGSWVFAQPLDRDWSNAGVICQEKDS